MVSPDPDVLRGGLTNKHIDVAELLKHTRCEATHPHILKGEKKGDQLIYKTPAPDFELSSFVLHHDESARFRPVTAEILLLIDGQATILHKDHTVVLKKGQPAALVLPGDEIVIHADEPAWIFKASVPQPN